MGIKITKPIDGILNAITMYRLMLYYLIFLLAVASVLSFFSFFPFNFLQLLLSTAVILLTCYITNKFFSLIFKIPANIESAYISALILVFIVLPAKTASELVFIILVGIIAMASKYILAINKKHIFNPAAIAVFITSIFSLGYATWWIGNQWMLPAVLIGGLLILRKIKKFSMVSGFLTVFLIATLSFSFINGSDLFKTLWGIILDSPILFFSFVMLVEPLTLPAAKKMQILYAVLVGVLSGSQFSIGPIYSTYETALVAGNIFSYFVSFKRRLVLILKEKIQMAPDIFEFVFAPNHKFTFIPGQYMEWTLSHKRTDSRGNRRYFTIAASPTEDNVRLGVRIDPDSSSSFKKALLSLTPGSKIYAGQLAGDFILPKNKSQKLVFIAGGIGITPFRSMIKNLIDKKENRDIVLFYVCSQESEFVFKDVFAKAQDFGLKTVYVCSHPSESWKGRSGRIDGKMIKEGAPDFKNRTYYLSGPNAMVEAYKKMLGELGIRLNKIVTDYFPGY